jgi:hypothetical protein
MSLDGERLARIETKLDELLLAKKDTEDRIRGLERARWLLAGAITLVAALFKFFR